MRLVLARHGQTAANVARVIDTALPGPGLTDLGRAQAAALGTTLAGDASVVAVLGSAARRAQQTAALVAAALGLPAEVLDGVHEVQVGTLEGRSDDAAITAFGDVFARWRDGDLDARFPGGESGAEVLARFGAAVDRVRARTPDDATAVVVTHGAALRLAVEMLVGATVGHAEDRVDNCGRVVLSSTPGRGWRLDAWLGDAPGGAPSARDATTGGS